jgi:hypothetical protein
MLASATDAPINCRKPRRETFSSHIGTEGYSWHVIDNSTRGRLVRRGGMLPGFENSLRWYRDADLVILFTINSNMGFRIQVARGIEDILKRHLPGLGQAGTD